MQQADWFAEAFGKWYPLVYAHHDDASARAEAAFAVARLGLRSGADVMDLACGSGRHLRALERLGFRTTGLDLSRDLLMLSRDSGLRRLVRGDMRKLPFGDGAFAAVTHFFTSFGYFSERAEDARVLIEVARVLAPGGGYFLDYLDAEAVRSSLSPRTVRDAGGLRVTEERKLEADCVVKRVVLERGGRREASYEERVRLYERSELEGLLCAAGFRVARVDRAFPGGGGSPRMLFTAART